VSGRWTAALAAAVALAALALWIDARRGVPSHEAATHGLPPVVRFEPAQIRAVTLRSAEVVVRTTRTGGGWSGTERPDSVDDFLRDVAQLAELLALDAGPALAQYGLAPAQGTIELERETGETIVLLLGRRNPAGTGSYVRVGPHGRVVLTGALVSWAFDKLLGALAATPTRAG
jgi:hypothetical protein